MAYYRSGHYVPKGEKVTDKTMEYAEALDQFGDRIAELETALQGEMDSNHRLAAEELRLRTALEQISEAVWTDSLELKQIADKALKCET